MNILWSLNLKYIIGGPGLYEFCIKNSKEWRKIAFCPCFHQGIVLLDQLWKILFLMSWSGYFSCLMVQEDSRHPQLSRTLILLAKLSREGLQKYPQRSRYVSAKFVVFLLGNFTSRINFQFPWSNLNSKDMVEFMRCLYDVIKCIWIVDKYFNVIKGSLKSVKQLE